MTVALTIRALTQTQSKVMQSRSAVQSGPQGTSPAKKAENGIRDEGVGNQTVPQLVGSRCK